jgi:thiamine-phosphate diphosphorylase
VNTSNHESLNPSISGEPRIANREPRGKPPIICVVTDARGDTVRTVARIRAAADAGVDFIQIREPLLPARALLELTRQACDIVQGTSTRIVVNDRLDVALPANAHGVHLRGSSYSAARVRATVTGELLIGRSVHDLDEAVFAEQEGGCNYLLFGTVFPSANKPEGHRIAGLQALNEVCARVTLPVIAIGGITRATAGNIPRTGAAGIAAIGLFDDADTIPSVVDFVRRTFDT